MPTRKSYAGGAVPTTIASGAFGIGATALTLTVATGWPTTAGGPFVATVDRGTATEEHVLVAARAGTALSSITRGYDGTSEVAHGPNATIEHRWDAVSADEANRMASLLTTKGDTVAHDGTQPQRVPVGTTAGQALLVTPAAATGVAYAQPLSNLVTTKGDLLAGTGAGAIARQGVGSNQQYLAADSAQTNGVGYTWKGIPVFASTALRDAAITAPTAGMVCYINSADIFEGIYTYGVAWRPGSWNVSWGIVSYASTTGSNSTSGTTATDFLTGAAFTAVTNRYYVITYSSIWTGTQASDIYTVEARDGGTGAAIMGSSSRYTTVNSLNQDGQTYRTIPFTLTAGSHTPWLIVTRVSGVGTLSSLGGGTYTSLVVEDVGPGTVPA